MQVEKCLGSAVSSPAGSGGAPAANAFLRILGSHDASHDNILVVCVQIRMTGFCWYVEGKLRNPSLPQFNFPRSFVQEASCFYLPMHARIVGVAVLRWPAKIFEKYVFFITPAIFLKTSSRNFQRMFRVEEISRNFQSPGTASDRGVRRPLYKSLDQMLRRNSKGKAF